MINKSISDAARELDNTTGLVTMPLKTESVSTPVALNTDSFEIDQPELKQPNTQLPWLSESVQFFKHYKLGMKIKFWHQGTHNWYNGNIDSIQIVSGYFLFIRIKYTQRKKELREDIYREDWLAEASVIKESPRTGWLMSN